MVYDCFTFRDEVETLKMRLEILDLVVDKFVISEANKTHSNIDKPFVFKEHESEFSEWADKIVYVQVELDDSGLDFSKKDESFSPDSPSWVFENSQRNSLDHGLSNLQDDDIVMIGDLDEIPNPNFLSTIIDNIDGQTHISTIQSFFYYYVNMLGDGQGGVWCGTVVCSGKNYKELYDRKPQRLRDLRCNGSLLAQGAGWHFSYLGGVDTISKKISSFSHTEYNNERYNNAEHIKSSIDNGKSLYSDDTFSMINMEEFFPKNVLDVLLKHDSFIRCP